MGSGVTIVEVGPRDGLQAEPTLVAPSARIDLVRRLAAAGLTEIEAGAFVSPKRVPQMADSASVLMGLAGLSGVRLHALVPNLVGLDAALATPVDTVSLFVAASETFSQRNINCSIAESLDRAEPVVAGARAAGRRVRGYVSCVLGCPYEGAVDAGRAAAVAETLIGLGCDEVSLGDTIGVGTPAATRALLTRLRRTIPIERLALHLHDTYGQALANVLVGIDGGITVVDAAVAGLGGCPFAPGASGNLATEDLVYMLAGLGLADGIDQDALAATGAWISGHLSRPNGSRAGRARLAAVRGGAKA